MMSTDRPIPDAAVEAAAAAIANARAIRRGVPSMSNVLVFLRTNPTLAHLYDEVMEDARVAIAAADAIRSEDAL